MPRQTKAQAEAASKDLTVEDAATPVVEAEAVTDVPVQPEPTEETVEAQNELAVEQSAAVVAAVPAEDPAAPAAEEAGQTETPAPSKAGSIEVKVLHVAFNYIDSDGMYQTVLKGDFAKVTAAQADRGVELGAVERV